ncbi:MAG: hypothetical protein EG822_13075 [Deltaproteobacteria bacterium]|nr:hypothetical protein [Deltaproteobacteria bacterium]TLN02300.1 MAG: hypothetical protein FDZ73_12245 [bacterium]
MNVATTNPQDGSNTSALPQEGEQTLKAPVKGKKTKSAETVAMEKAEFQKLKDQKEKERKERLDRKLDRAARPDTVVISRTTMDTNEMADLVGANDRLMNQLRRKIGYVKALTPTKFEELFNRSQEIKQSIHEFNKELARITGDRYVAPRSYLEGRQS